MIAYGLSIHGRPHGKETIQPRMMSRGLVVQARMHQRVAMYQRLPSLVVASQILKRFVTGELERRLFARPGCDVLCAAVEKIQVMVFGGLLAHAHQRNRDAAVRGGV